MNRVEQGPEKVPPIANPDQDEIPDDPRLMLAVQEYLKQLESGLPPHRQEFLRRYPDLTEPLAQCLDGLELVHKAAIRKKQPLSSPVLAATGSGDTLPANPLGDFQIIREIGRGGMGIVYEALQLSLGRNVALKVLPFAATFDAKHLQRFQNEARAAAQLHHTNIVPVYGVGCERGVHYYAMQLIEGQSLATLIHEIKRQESGDKGQEAEVASRKSGVRGQETGIKVRDGEATGPFLRGSGHGRPDSLEAGETISPMSLALTTQRSGQHAKFFFTVAKFMVQAAEAVEHAHQLGIVHRDIKPANLLVDAHNRLWVTDFGLAQFHTDVALTQTGDILGTLRYMSPEQASGKKLLDHRTDVYSLGATLYELVTLEPIFPGRNRQELLHQIINEEPRPPRALEKSIPVELETIILKAVSKNPSDRYGTAQDFANDLQRYLEDKPILAKRPSLVERARKWSRRHPSVVVAGMLVLVVCLVGLVVSNWMIAQEQAKTKAALNNEKERALQARQAVDLLVDIADQELADHPFFQGVRKRLLQAALFYYRDLINTHGSDEGAQAVLQAGNEKAQKLLAELSTLEGFNLIELTQSPDVRRDLSERRLPLRDTQLSKLNDLDGRVRDERDRLFRQHRPGTAEYRRRQLELAKDQKAALKEILEPSQLERLQQIETQRAFHELSVVDVLNLTADQTKKIRAIKSETMWEMWVNGPEKGGPGGPGGPGKNMKGDRMKFDEIRGAELEKIEAILTPQQREQWKELTGLPFKGGFRRPPPHGDGPGKGGHKGPGGGKGTGFGPG